MHRPMGDPVDAALHLSTLVQQVDLFENERSTREARAILEGLAVSLRQSDHRLAVGLTDLSHTLARILDLIYGSLPPLPSWLESLAGEVGRVAANLVVDCDENRMRSLEAGYLPAVLRILDSSPSISPQPRRFLTASLLNQVVDGHEASIERLSRHDFVPKVWRLLDAVDTRAWSLHIIATISEFQCDDLAQALDDHNIAILCDPFTLGHDSSYTETPTMVFSGRILEYLTASRVVNPEPFFAERSSDDCVLFILADFLERGQIDTKDALTETGTSEAKASLARALVSVSSSVKSGPDSRYWRLLERWVETSREDLISVGLLCYGNLARDDATTVALLSGNEHLLNTILRLLQGERPVLLQHALYGMLKNLSVPNINKERLGDAGVLDLVLDRQPWQKEMDSVESVQGSAIGAVKNLCRISSNATRLVSYAGSIDSLIDFIARCQNSSLRFEATRILVNITRSLLSGPTRDWRAMNDPRVFEAYERMLVEGKQHQVLANEAIVALTLSAIYLQGSAAVICRQLMAEESGALEVLVELYRQQDVPNRELQHNADTLLKSLAGVDDEHGSGVRQAVASTTGKWC